MNSLKEEMGGFVGSKVERVPCDITHWTDVAAAASKISKATDKIRILINNGGRGIMTHQLTSYSIDEHIVVNHIGYVILNSHLLPILKKTSETNKVRIVILGSILHESAPTDTKFALLDEIKTDLGPHKQYARSKLAVMLYAR